MSVVVAIKKNNVIYMGADSQVTKGGSRISLSNPNNYKIWKVKDVNHCLIGHVGNVRDACVIRIMKGLINEIDEMNKKIDFEYVVDKILPKMIQELKDKKYLSSGDHFEGLDSKFLFAYRDKLFSIGSDGSVLEIDDCVAIGSGESEAIGSLLTTNHTDEPVGRIIKAIKSSAAHDIYVDYPIVITNTESTEYKVIDQLSIRKKPQLE